MTANAGVLRSATGLAAAATELSALAGRPGTEPATGSWEVTNLLTVATALVDAAALREETRGSHWREDFPERDDDHWHGHVDVRLDEGGRLCTAFRRTEPTDRSEQ
jgi:L-aspartate oxidase